MSKSASQPVNIWPKLLCVVMLGVFGLGTIMTRCVEIYPGSNLRVRRIDSCGTGSTVEY